jgi:hypothetical protein
MTRLPTLLLALGLVLSQNGCKKAESGPVRGSGVGSKAVRSTPPFRTLKIGGTVRAEVEVGKPQSVELLGDDNLLPLVLSKVEGGTLTIMPDQVLKPTQPLVARIKAPSLDGIEVIVASSGLVTGVNASHFTVRAAGGSKLELAGSSQTVEIVTRGAAQVNLKDFAVATAHVTTSEATRVTLGRVQTLEVNQKGPSLVTYEGSPEVRRTSVPPARLLRTGT